MRTDPKYRAEVLTQKRETWRKIRRRHPERLREQRRAWRALLRRDPERWRRWKGLKKAQERRRKERLRERLRKTDPERFRQVMAGIRRQRAWAKQVAADPTLLDLEKTQARRRWKRRLRPYRITLEGFQRLYRKQGGRCAICRREGRLQIDHDHRTGRVRGLLCRECNVALGLLRDSLESLRAAVRYLRS